MFYLQFAAAVVSLLIGLATITKESAPIIQKVQENQRKSEIRRHQEVCQKRATEISQMGLNWQFRGHDGTWRYYSDPTGRYWSRVNIQGVYEYSENNQIQMASNPSLVR